jgi:hypothetical protein
MTVRLKPITENSWLVLGDTDDLRIGLLNEIQNKYILTIKGEKKNFLDRKEVNKYFNEDIFNNVAPTIEENVKKDYFINGYPVDFDNPNEVVIKGNKLPLFSKKATSEVYYVAGYYCLHFPKNWMPSMCPKWATLQQYEYMGPFKTEDEMKFELRKLRANKRKIK